MLRLGAVKLVCTWLQSESKELGVKFQTDLKPHVLQSAASEKPQICVPD